MARRFRQTDDVPNGTPDNTPDADQLPDKDLFDRIGPPDDLSDRVPEQAADAAIGLSLVSLILL